MTSELCQDTKSTTAVFRVPFLNSRICRIPSLEAFLGSRVETSLLPPVRTTDTKWLGWGCKKSAQRALWCARVFGGEALRLEDGFLRSFGTGDSFPPLSLVVDDRGIYYDATRCSALEDLLASPDDLLAGIAHDVARAKAMLLEHRLSKYNHGPLLDPSCLRSADSQRVLVIDQTVGDMSVVLGGASAATFRQMLLAARAENPRATIYVKTHPEVTGGRKAGYLSWVHDTTDTEVLRRHVNPLSLIERMDRVYTVTSTMGFEALVAGKPVTVFGMPWYAGWGATDDRQICPRRSRSRSVDELFAAAYFHYSRYLNPETHRRGTLFDVIHWTIRQRDSAIRSPGRMISVGFRWWRSANVGPMLSLTPERTVFAAEAKAARALDVTDKDSLIWWGTDAPSQLLEIAEEAGASVVRMEDGFVRSVGLGSDLIRPLSLVMDKRGIYFNPTQPSDLEHILSTGEFSPEELDRARRAREIIVAHGITKYNVEPREKASWQHRGSEVVLVVGQVEDDASIRYGCTVTATNRALLSAARCRHPRSFLVYKPHPDVVSGNRVGAITAAELLTLADHVESRLSVVSCIEACDVVHTMTSLSGFDALLRGKRVVVHGQPFYAGWGLTEDLFPEGVAFDRRRRRLTLDELVAGTLLRYPVYWDWELNGYTTCEAILHTIVETRDRLEKSGRFDRLRAGFLARPLRRLRAVSRGLAYRIDRGSRREASARMEGRR